MAKQPGVEQVSVDIGAGTAQVSGSGFDTDKLKAAVEAAGFSVG